MIDFGTVRPGTTLYVPFATYDSNDPTASVTMTGLAVTDIEIYKDGGTTQRASDAGYTLLDTDGIDFDGVTGIHGFSINLADNTTAGFYAAGSQYWVVVSSITVDAGTINFIAATFRIGIPDAVLNTTIATLASQTSFTLTAGPADDDALNGCVVYIHDVASAVQGGWAVVSDYTGSSRTVTLTAGTTFTAAASDNIAIFSPVNTRWIGATAQTARDIGANVLLTPGTGTGQISLTSGAVTAGTVSDKTGYSLTATTGLGNQTANITGNLSGSVGSVTGAVGSVTGAVGSVTGVVSANVTQWLGTAAATPTVAGVPEVDITHVVGTATTATFDSLSSQISAIGSGTGAALNFAVSEDNASTPIKTVTAVGTQTGTYANTMADDGTVHQIDSVGNAIDWIYGFSCGVAKSASKFICRANLSATGDTVTVSAYNFGTTNWDTRTTITGTAETLRDIPLLAAHTGTSGADTGKVYLRFTFSEGDAGTLIIDEAYVQAQQSGSLVGYSDGAVWLNTGASNVNTVPYVDGVADNPVSTIAAALTLAVALNLKRIRVANGSSVTLGAAVEAYSLVGKNWNLALGGQSISGSYIEGATVTGTATGANPPEFAYCHFVGAASAPTLPPCTLMGCGINTTGTYPFTAGSAGQFLLVDCFSEVSGSGTPHFTFAGANGVNIRHWSGGSNVTLNNASTSLSLEVLAGGGQTIAVGGADVEIRGICREVTLTGVTTNSTVQIDAVTGPISIAGADGTVNIYGVCGVVTDSRTGTPTLSNVAVSRATINAEADTALADIHLDHLLAADYDPASKPGVATALLNELVESDSGVSRFTQNALEQAPTAGGTPQTGDSYAYLVSNLGAAGAGATEAGGTGDHLTAIPYVGSVTDQTSGSVWTA